MVLPRGSNRKTSNVRTCARAIAGIEVEVSSTSLIDGRSVAMCLINEETIERGHITRHGRASSLYWLSLVVRRHAPSRISVIGKSGNCGMGRISWRDS